MKKIVELIEQARAALEAEKVRTPHLDIADGRLDAALKHLVAHGEDLERRAKERAEQIAAKEKELAGLKNGVPGPLPDAAKLAKPLPGTRALPTE